MSYEEYAIKIGDRLLSPPGTDCECDWIFETRREAENLIAARRAQLAGFDTREHQIMAREVSPWRAIT